MRIETRGAKCCRLEEEPPVEQTTCSTLASQNRVILESRNAVHDLVGELITREFGVATQSVLPSARLVDDLGLDSIDLCDALVRMETLTGQPFPLERFRTVSTLGDFIDRAADIALPQRE